MLRGADVESNKRALGIIFLTVFVDLLGFGIVLPLLPLYAEHLNANEMTIGLLMSSFSAMQFIFSPLWGRLSDRIGRRPVLIVGLFGSVVAYATFGYASMIGSLPLLFVSRIGAGIAGATIATAQAYIADSTPPERRTAGLALIGAAFGIGFTFGPLIGSMAVSFDSSGTATDASSPMPGFWAAGISGIALCFAIFMLPESLKPGTQAGKRQWLDPEYLRAALTTTGVAQLIIAFFTAMFGFAMFENNLSFLNKRVFGFDIRSNFYLFAYTGFSMILAQGCVVRPLSRKIDDRTLSMLGIVLMMFGLLGVVGSSMSKNLTMFYVILPVLITGFAAVTTSIQAQISRRSRPDQQGGILGINQAGSALARILGPFIGIQLFPLQLEGRIPEGTLPFLASAALMMVVFITISRLPEASDSESNGNAG